MTTQQSVFPCNYKLPEGSLPGQFCENHTVTDSDPDGNACRILIDQGLGRRCPYLTPDEAINGLVIGSSYIIAKCGDFSLRLSGHNRQDIINS